MIERMNGGFQNRAAAQASPVRTVLHGVTVSPSSCCLSLRGGVGAEYLDFSFDAVRRVSFVAVKIPPLPHGPLSVLLGMELCGSACPSILTISLVGEMNPRRDFHLLAGGSSESPESWMPASPVPLQTPLGR